LSPAPLWTTGSQPSSVVRTVRPNKLCCGWCAAVGSGEDVTVRQRLGNGSGASVLGAEGGRDAGFEFDITISKSNRGTSKTERGTAADNVH
jgi:hypothetical protein